MKNNINAVERESPQNNLEQGNFVSHDMGDVGTSSSVVLASFSRNGKITSINRYGRELTGFTDEELIGKDWFTTFLSPDIANVKKPYFMALFNGENSSLEIEPIESPLVTRSRTQRSIVWNFVPVRDEKGTISGVAAAGLDITDRSNAGNDLVHHDLNYIKELFSFPQTGLVILDAKTHEIIDVNQKAVEMIGLDQSNIIGSVCHKFICPAEKGKCPITDLGQTVDHSERILLTPGGQRVPIIKSVIQLTIQGRDCLLESIYDNTDLKAKEADLQRKSDELARSNLELQQFAYIASHDLQEPLRAISGFTELLAKRYQGKIDERADKYIYYITDGTSRMQQMINDLLLYSRVQTQAHEFVTTDSKRALDQALANLGALIKGSNAVITSEHLPKITADSDQMIVIFQNLIGNAIKYQKPGVVPEIHVSAQKDENNWTFSVTDNGIGIDEKYVDRLFKIFSRLHTRTEYPGTGIGLAVCKRIVERHGGTIGVTSVPDAGSTFSFTIPLQQKENKS